MSDVAHAACPFCGSRNLAVKPLWQKYRFVACQRCKAAGPIGINGEDAKDKWDHRAMPEQPGPEQMELF